MTDLTPSYRLSATRSSVLAFGFALASVATWLLAAAADELWLPAAVLGLVAAALGWRSRREPTGGKLALVSLVVGGLVASQVIVFTIAWGVYHLAT